MLFVQFAEPIGIAHQPDRGVFAARRASAQVGIKNKRLRVPKFEQRGGVESRTQVRATRLARHVIQSIAERLRKQDTQFVGKRDLKARAFAIGGFNWLINKFTVAYEARRRMQRRVLVCTL